MKENIKCDKCGGIIEGFSEGEVLEICGCPKPDVWEVYNDKVDQILLCLQAENPRHQIARVIHNLMPDSKSENMPKSLRETLEFIESKGFYETSEHIEKLFKTAIAVAQKEESHIWQIVAEEKIKSSIATTKAEIIEKIEGVLKTNRMNQDEYTYVDLKDFLKELQD